MTERGLLTVDATMLQVSIEDFTRWTLVQAAQWVNPTEHVYFGCDEHGMHGATWHEPIGWAEQAQACSLIYHPN